MAGWLQAALAVLALGEVARRFVFGSDPEPPLMMLMSLVALGANVACLWLVSRHRDGGAHMKTSTIFPANDVLANVGVLAPERYKFERRDNYPGTGGDHA